MLWSYSELFQPSFTLTFLFRCSNISFALWIILTSWVIFASVYGLSLEELSVQNVLSWHSILHLELVMLDVSDWYWFSCNFLHAKNNVQLFQKSLALQSHFHTFWWLMLTSSYGWCNSHQIQWICIWFSQYLGDHSHWSVLIPDSIRLPVFFYSQIQCSTLPLDWNFAVIVEKTVTGYLALFSDGKIVTVFDLIFLCFSPPWLFFVPRSSV